MSVGQLICLHIWMSTSNCFSYGPHMNLRVKPCQSMSLGIEAAESPCHYYVLKKILRSLEQSGLGSNFILLTGLVSDTEEGRVLSRN